jgi:transposase
LQCFIVSYLDENRCNLPAHKGRAIAPLIEAVGARILYLSPYSPEFNPIEHWWLQLKAFLRQFSPTTLENGGYTHCDSDGFNQS